MTCSHTQRSNGSSPHARGTRSSPADRKELRRFIPACAGNTAFPRCTCATAAVHPRMRGEHGFVELIGKYGIGSSPHARGTPARRPRAGVHRRFIPACAGNTHPLRPEHRPDAVHPRMRGEHIFGSTKEEAKRGSSPHARGTPRYQQPFYDEKRFIPACAGNTARIPARRVSHSVHPRMRGEQQHVARDQRPGRGSSPHARGTPLGPPCGGLWCRFIPACAGNTCSA